MAHPLITGFVLGVALGLAALVQVAWMVLG